MATFYELKRTYAKFSATDRDATLRRLAENMRAIQCRWPRKVDFSRLLPDCAIAIFPLFFIEAFGQIDEDRLLHFLSGCKLLASAITIADSLFDEEFDRDERTALFLRWHGLQFELERELGKTFAPESPFWQALREALAEYLRGIVNQSSYASGRRRLCDATYDECVALGLAKSCVSRVAIVGLGLLGDDVSRTDALLRSLEKYNLARQIWDDVQDWKADIRSNLPTFVTVRLAASLARRDVSSSELELATMARELHYGGHVDELLGLARASLASALDAADRERPLPWHALLEALDRSIEALQCDLDKIVRRNRGRQSHNAASA